MKITASKKKILIGLAIILLIVAGLRLALRDRAPRYNAPLTTQSPPPAGNDPALRGMWPDTFAQDDTTLMMVAFSGGGSRAAAVGWKTLETLQKVSYPAAAGSPGKDSNLAREIDMVAGISGGSFAAAAWCLFGGDLAPFQKHFVERNIQAELAKNLFSGKGGVALFSRRYEPINFAAALYDAEVYERKTFADLPPRPLLRMHS